MTQGSQPNPNEPNPYQPSSGQPPYGYGQPQYDGQARYSGQPQSDGQSQSDGPPRYEGQLQYGGQSQSDGQPRYQGQPQYGVQPPYGFGQSEPAAQQQPGSYGQPGYHEQNYYPAAPQAYGQARAVPYGYAEPARSPLLGMIALGVVAVATVVLAWAMWRIGSVMGPLIASNGGSMSGAELTDVMMEQLGDAAIAAMNFAFYAGVAGWITGIVATATRRGRSYGVWAIILGVLSPVIAMFVAVAALMPFLSY